MPLSGLDATSIARSLSQIAERPEDLADAFFERLEEVELADAEEPLGVRTRREEGLAVRLVRGGQTWLAARDRLTGDAFLQALRQVARALPSAAYPQPSLATAPFAEPDDLAELADFPGAVRRAVRRQFTGFPYRLSVRRHARWTRVVGTRLAPEPQSERFFSCRAESAWGGHGALLADLGEASAEQVAGDLVQLFRARQAPPPASRREAVVLAPAASAVLLHEVVAHALETDTLVLGGRTEAALGVRLGSERLDVVDDPASAPPGVRRTTDDEGTPVTTRWLLRGGVVQQPLADLFAARSSSRLTPGAARRADRHQPPVPRSTHLVLLAGDAPRAELLAAAEGGLWVAQVARGRLDALSGRFVLYLPWAQRIQGGAPEELVGPCRLEGRVSSLLEAVGAVGDDARPAGAGWCAKGGVKLPVWATAPSLRIDEAEVVA